MCADVAESAAHDSADELAVKQQQLHSQGESIQGLQADLADKGAQLAASARQVSLLTANLDELQSAVAKLEAAFAEQREEADSRVADLAAQLTASHCQVGQYNDERRL